MSRRRPPRLAMRLMALFLPAEDKKFLLGDLEEQYRRLCDRKGALRAIVWYWSEVLLVAGPASIERLMSRFWEPWSTRAPGIARDVRHSGRALVRSGIFAVAVVGIVSLCVGVNTAVFSALNGIVFERLPFDRADRLVQLYNIRSGSEGGRTSSQSSWTQFLDLRSRGDLFESAALVRTVTALVGPDEDVRRAKVQQVNAGFFDITGEQPVVGRFFEPEEVDPYSPSDVVVLSESVWEQRYGSDPGVLGTHVRYRGSFSGDVSTYTVIGVAPRRLDAFDAEAEFFAPFEFSNEGEADATTARYRDGNLWLLLQEGVAREAALAEVRAIESRWYADVASAAAKRSGRVYDRFEFDLAHPLEPYLYLLQAGSVFLLLMGGVSLATLFVNRSMERRYELSVRRALGGGSSVLRQLVLIEGMMLGATAAIFGSIVAMATSGVISRCLNLLDPTIARPPLDASLLFGLAAAAMGLVSALNVGSMELVGWKRSMNGGMNARSLLRGPRALRHAITVSQVAVACVMLTSAGLLALSFLNVLGVDRGFDARHVVQGRLDETTIGFVYGSGSDRTDLKQRVLASMRAIPGVESVSFSMNDLLSDDHRVGPNLFFRRGRPAEEPIYAMGYNVSTEFFETMGIPIVAGRGFDNTDDAYSVIVDELFVEQYLADGDAIGAEFWFRNTPPSDGEPWYRVVGVARRANLRGLESRDGYPILYHHHSTESGVNLMYTVLLRTSRPAEDVVAEMHTRLREIDGRLPLSYAGTLEQSVRDQIVAREAATFVLLCFAAFGLAASTLGIYGVLAYEVQRRRREIGLRTALGATTGQIVHSVLRTAASAAAVGVLFGLVGSLVMSRFLEAFLFDVAAWDLGVFGAVALAVVIVAVGASVGPSVRAARVHPRDVLRSV